MPVGERLRDPVTGEVLIVVASWSGRDLDRWLAARNGGLYRLASAERNYRSTESTGDPLATPPTGRRKERET
jgi:hypothetical protein